jgi:hypothetical protein
LADGAPGINFMKLLFGQNISRLNFPH